MGLAVAGACREQRVNVGADSGQCIRMRGELIRLIDLAGEYQRNRTDVRTEGLHDGLSVLDRILGQRFRDSG